MKVEVSAENYQKQQLITNEIVSLLKEIKRDTGGMSTTYHIMKHPNVQKLLDMGDKIVNFLFYLTVEYGADWVVFEILRQLTNQNPVKKENVGKFIHTTIDWLNWYVESDYYKNNDIYYNLVN
jgi:hypothetical protein